MRTGPLGPDEVVKQAFLVAQRLVPSETARDVAQDTWIKYQAQLIKEGPDWEPEQARGWIWRVASNGARSLLRRKRPQDGLEPDRFARDPGRADPARVVAQAEELELRTRQAWEILGELPRAKRELIVLRDLEGLSWREIGRVLSEKPRTLRSRYSRLKNELRRRVAHCVTGGEETPHV